MKGLLLMWIWLVSPNELSAQGAKIVFRFERAGLATPRYSMTVGEDGHLTYHAELAQAMDSASSAPTVDREMTLSAEATARVFELAHAAGEFRVECASKAKNIANTGQKTLTYVGKDGTGECTFNYSEVKPVAALTDLFLSTEATLEAGRRLDFMRRFDRLGLDAEMITLESMLESHQASSIETIAGTLRAIASDTELLARVRSRADKMLRMVRTAR